MSTVPEIDAAAIGEFCPPHLRHAAVRLSPLLYADLKRIARGERSRHISPHTLNTTSLVHDAFLRLADQQEFQSHTHFLRVAAVTMRHLLVDRARAQLAAKHGGHLARVELEDAQDFYVQEDEWVVAMHEALSRLARVSPRLSEVVECRIFAGYADEEIARALGISVRSVQRDWTMARAWLRREMGDAVDRPG